MNSLASGGESLRENGAPTLVAEGSAAGDSGRTVMATVGMNLALSLEGLLQRFPSLRDFGLRRLRRTHGEIPPANLAAIIESEIIPRLLVAHLADGSGHQAGAGPGPAIAAAPDRGGMSGAAAASALRRPPPADDVILPGEVGPFAQAAIEREVTDLLADVEAILARGVPPGAVLLDLLAPTAHELGRMWEADRCDFLDVTMGLWRLQELAHAIALRMPAKPAIATSCRALFAAMPGDNHGFGPLLVAKHFEASGWDAHCRTGWGADELCAELSAVAYDLVGLTVTQDRQVDGLPELIEALREASLNPAILVMVGGALLVERPELAFLVGADATAPDARTAVERAEALLRGRGMAGVWLG